MSNRKSKKRIFRDSMKENIRNTIHNNKSRKNYLNIVDAFCNYAYENGCRDKESVSVELINSYVQYLIDVRKLTPSSIHTYVSGVCCGLNNPDIKIANITKPKRHVSEYTRTRNAPEEYRWDADPNNPQFRKFVLLAKTTGLRRNEIKNIKIKDYRWVGEVDEFYSYLYIPKGKGGKKTLQRLLLSDEERIEFEKLFNLLDPDGYAFNKTPDDYVLDYETEFKGNSIATHGDLGRKGVAKRAYTYYYNRLMSEPGYREELERQCFEQVARLYKSKDGGPKKIKESQYKGYYYIRGKNREAILKKMQEDKGEHPYINIRLDKLALWAVSLFHLSHARIDVSTHYLLW